MKSKDVVDKIKHKLSSLNFYNELCQVVYLHGMENLT